MPVEKKIYILIKGDKHILVFHIFVSKDEAMYLCRLKFPFQLVYKQTNKQTKNQEKFT